MSRETKREEWVGRMADFAASGQSQKSWCEQNGVSLAQFTYWRRRLSTAAGSQSQQRRVSESQINWCTVRLATDHAGPALRVRVGDACIEVEPGFDAALLRAVVDALNGRAC